MNKKRAENKLSQIYKKIMSRIPEIGNTSDILKEAQIDPNSASTYSSRMILASAQLYDKNMYRVFHPESPPDKETLQYFVSLLSYTKSMLSAFGRDTERQMIVNMAGDLEEIIDQLRNVKMNHPQEVEVFICKLLNLISHDLPIDHYLHLRGYIDQNFFESTFSPEMKALWTKFSLEFEPLLRPGSESQLCEHINTLNAVS